MVIYYYKKYNDYIGVSITYDVTIHISFAFVGIINSLEPVIHALAPILFLKFNTIFYETRFELFILYYSSICVVSFIYNSTTAYFSIWRKVDDFK